MLCADLEAAAAGEPPEAVVTDESPPKKRHRHKHKHRAEEVLQDALGSPIAPEASAVELPPPESVPEGISSTNDSTDFRVHHITSYTIKIYILCVDAMHKRKRHKKRPHRVHVEQEDLEYTGTQESDHVQTNTVL